MTDLRTAAQQALEALEGGADSWQRVGPAIDALKAALAEPVEPVKQCMAHGECFGGECIYQRPAEPVPDPDSPARRCGGPGCDGTCCQPVQEPVVSAGLGPLPEPAQPAEPEGYMPGCLWPLPATPDYYTAAQMREYALRALAKPVQEPQGCDHCNSPLYAAIKCRVCGRVTEPTPPQRKPLSEEEIFKIENDIPDDVISDRVWTIWFARAVERAHGIGGAA